MPAGALQEALSLALGALIDVSLLWPSLSNATSYCVGVHCRYQLGSNKLDRFAQRSATTKKPVCSILAAWLLRDERAPQLRPNVRLHEREEL
jgi:hypothetical protein